MSDSAPHYRVVPLFAVSPPTYVHGVSTPEAETIGELIADCADIPAAVRTAVTAVPLPGTSGDWTVTEECVERVSGLDEYV